MVTAAATPSLHIDLDLVAPVFLAAPDEPQNVTADHGEYKFGDKERGDFGTGCALGEQDAQLPGGTGSVLVADPAGPG